MRQHSNGDEKPQYDKEQVLQRLQIIYGKADKVKQRIDTALSSDDIHHRRRVMHPLGLPQRFPAPQSMKNYSTSTWIAWIREENNDLIAAIDEENARRRDPDDPFDGTAGGIFAPLEHQDEHEVHQPQNTSGFKRCDTGPQIDESENLNIQNEKSQDSRLEDVLNTNPQHQDVPEQMTIPKTIQGAASQPQRPSNKQQLDISTSQSVGDTQAKRGETDGSADQLQMNTTRDRRVEESHDQEAQNPLTQNRDEQAEERIEDPFRALRDFHERQCKEKQEEKRQRHSAPSQSTPGGAVGKAKQNYPTTQRANTKIREPNVVNTYQNQLPHQGWKEHEVSHPDSYLQGRHNTTSYMNLPNSIQNKTCGRCGLVGHIKKQCREEVYCKFCRTSSHSIRACRTYANFLRVDPVTSSRKNTPEKRMSEDIDREIAMRVQQEMKRILTDLETNRQVNQSSHRQIATRVGRVQNLIVDYQCPPEVLENVGNVQNRLNMRQQPQETYSILNQRWEDPPHMQAPMAPMNVNVENNEYQKMEPPYPIVNAPVNSMTVTNRQVEMNGPGVNPMQPNNTKNSHRSQISGILSTNMTSRGVEHSVLNGQTLENREQREDVNMNYRGNTYTDPVNHDSRQEKSLQDLRRSGKKSGN